MTRDPGTSALRDQPVLGAEVTPWKVQGRCVVAGLPFGPILILAGFQGLRMSDTELTDQVLWGLLAFPTAVLLVPAVVASASPRDAMRWVAMAIGAAVGTAVMVVIVIGGISALTWMISDPIPSGGR